MERFTCEGRIVPIKYCVGDDGHWKPEYQRRDSSGMPIPDKSMSMSAPKIAAKVGGKGPQKPVDVEDASKTATQNAYVPNYMRQFDCPFPGCKRKSLSKNGLAAHYGLVHGVVGAPKLDWSTITSYQIDPSKTEAPKRNPYADDPRLVLYKCPFPGCDKDG